MLKNIFYKIRYVFFLYVNIILYFSFTYFFVLDIYFMDAELNVRASHFEGARKKKCTLVR